MSERRKNERESAREPEYNTERKRAGERERARRSESEIESESQRVRD